MLQKKSSVEGKLFRNKADHGRERVKTPS